MGSSSLSNFREDKPVPSHTMKYIVINFKIDLLRHNSHIMSHLFKANNSAIFTIFRILQLSPLSNATIRSPPEESMYP